MLTVLRQMDLDLGSGAPPLFGFMDGDLNIGTRKYKPCERRAAGRYPVLVLPAGRLPGVNE